MEYTCEDKFIGEKAEEREKEKEKEKGKVRKEGRQRKNWTTFFMRNVGENSVAVQ